MSSTEDQSGASLPAAAAEVSTQVLDKALDAEGLKGTEAGSGEQANGGNGNEGELKTVFDDAEKPTVKHPLYSKWTLYYSAPHLKNLPKTPATSGPDPGKAQGWMEDIKQVVKVDSVEEFWGLYNNIIGPSMFGQRADYYLFKDDIIPAWEDPANKHGGKWSVQFPRAKYSPQIDTLWLNMMLAAIGETYEVDEKDTSTAPASAENSNLLTGVIINVRPNFFRLNIWTRAAPSDPSEASELRDQIMRIGKHFKMTVLGFAEDFKVTGAKEGGFATEVEFASHKDSEKKGNTKKIVL